MISVIIPTYLPQRYIEECLSSIEHQTIDHNLYEVIVILNGPRMPYKYLQNLLYTYSFKYKLLYTEISGVSNARNIGLDNASGEYVCFIDDDDMISNNYLKELYAIAAVDSLVVTNVLTFDRTIEYLGKDYLSHAFEKNKRFESMSFWKKRSFFSSSCCKPIPMAIIKDRRFNRNFSLGEDALFMASISDSVENIILSPQNVIYYRRIRQGSASRRKHSFYESIVNRLRLIGEYVKLYFIVFPHANFFFFLSRVVAVMRN